MSTTILLGRGSRLVEFSRQVWEQHLAEVPRHQQTRLAFMTEAHHRVRYWVVRELPHRRDPITAEIIAQALGLPAAQVTTILDDLEQHLFFLARNAQRAVTWAFPVTLDRTPHELRFSTGEHCYAA